MPQKKSGRQQPAAKSPSPPPAPASKLLELENVLLLKASEAGQVIGFSKAFVYKLIRRRELPAIVVAGNIRVPVDALRKWIDAQAAAAAIHGPGRASRGQYERRRSAKTKTNAKTKATRTAAASQDEATA
jgi:excisionase family DNA binding protein